MAAHHYHVFETSGGFCGIAWNSRGIARFQLPTQSHDATERLLLRRTSGAERSSPSEDVGDAIGAVKQYFMGSPVDFSRFALDIADQNEVFRRIYAAVRRVGWGQTTTYGTLAREVGEVPEGARTVGQAMARNPVPLIIPCHRVLAAGDRLGGFSAPGGALSKARMLDLEGVRLAQPEPAQQSLAF